MPVSHSMTDSYTVYNKLRKLKKAPVSSHIQVLNIFIGVRMLAFALQPAHNQLQGTGHLAQGHAGSARGLGGGLLHGVGHVDETAPDGEVFARNQMEQGVHHVVADIGAGGVGDKGGNAVLFQRRRHVLEGQGGEVGGGAPGDYGLVHRLNAVVIR